MDTDRGRPLFPKLLHRLFHRVFLNIRDDYPHSVAGGFFAKGLAKTRATTGNDCDIVSLEIHAQSSWFAAAFGARS
jgi:hypothetical protein